MALLLGAFYSSYNFLSAVTFESSESLTIEGKPVFNKVSFKSEASLDTWMMKQSHKGANLPAKEWDEIRITVDRSQTPSLVRYSQWEGTKEIPLKAVCFKCHANGPRSIRPKPTLSLKERFIITMMNLRMKTYGRVETSLKVLGDVPVKFKDGEKLQVKICMKCHQKDFWWGRGELQKQHSGTIAHLVKTGQMPPWPHSLSDKEREEIFQFTKDPSLL